MYIPLQLKQISSSFPQLAELTGEILSWSPLSWKDIFLLLTLHQLRYFMLVSESFLTSLPPLRSPTHPSSPTVVMGWDTNPLQVSPLTVCHLYPNVSLVIYSCAALVSQSWSGFKSWQAWFFSQLHKLCLNLWWSTLHAILILLQQPLCLLTKMTLYPGQLSVKYILHCIADSGETCIHANSPGLSGSLPDTAPISRSPVRVTISPG